MGIIKIYYCKSNLEVLLVLHITREEMGEGQMKKKKNRKGQKEK